MKIVYILFIGLLSGFTYLDIAQVREDFKLASKERESAFTLLEKLTSVTKEDQKVLVAYKGTVMAITAKYTKDNQERKTGLNLV